MTLRIGQGFDVHPFSPDPHRPLVLGGVVLEGARGLAGHSDADALSHALCDALLGAACLGDIGRHFPDSDPAFSGALSLDLLAEVVRRVRRAGFVALNADCTVLAETPTLSPYLDQMAAALAEVVGAPVSVKATRGEGLGAVGRAEGIACMAVALVAPAPGDDEGGGR